MVNARRGVARDSRFFFSRRSAGRRFGSEATTATFDVPITLDRVDETVTVTVAPGDGFTGNWTPATSGANSATVTIKDAETLSFSSTTVSAETVTPVHRGGRRGRGRSG